MSIENDELRWQDLTHQMEEIMRQHDALAAERERITRRLYSRPGVTHRSLGARLGVSGVTINRILHRGEPKAGRAA
jgi:hypothetical protein